MTTNDVRNSCIEFNEIPPINKHNSQKKIIPKVGQQKIKIVKAKLIPTKSKHKCKKHFNNGIKLQSLNTDTNVVHITQFMELSNQYYFTNMIWI